MPLNFVVHVAVHVAAFRSPVKSALLEVACTAATQGGN